MIVLVVSGCKATANDPRLLRTVQKLADDHLLFQNPDAPAVLSTGAGRHWPHGRGNAKSALPVPGIWQDSQVWPEC